jgi:hypothetical protein
MFDKTFGACVDVLERMAKKLGTTYMRINVWRGGAGSGAREGVI